MDFYHLLKILIKIQVELLKVWAVNIVRNFLIVLKKSTKNAIKTTWKRAIQKTAEATGDLIGNKIADKITSVSTELHPKSPNELRLKELHTQINDANSEIEVPKERYISPGKRQQIIDE